MIQNYQSPETLPQKRSANPDHWLSVYLYYSEPWENFLLSAVMPFIKTLEERRWAQHFFFIRYWENGPHIRLRIQGEKETLVTNVKPFLITYFENYFHHFPSYRQQSLIDTIGKQWYANNSILLVDYEPEVERYGGEEGMRISERQFELSSRVVIAIFSESENFNYQKALGKAILLHLGFVHALKMNKHYAYWFFYGLYKGWLSRSEQVWNQLKENHSEVGVNDAFASAFEKQRDALLPHVSGIWLALKRDEQFEEDWFNQWVEEMNSIYVELCLAKKNGRITDYQFNIPQGDLFLRHYLHNQFLVFDSHMHMTNNRLGISNHDEGYLYYLIARCLEIS